MKKSYFRMLALIVLLCAACCAFAANSQPGCVLKPGDRMVFLGDSITEQQIYTKYTMDYFALRYPELKITFRNAGWGGDRAPGALARLQRDVIDLKPNVVSICLGMNDAAYQAFNQEGYDTYIKAMKGIVSELKKAGVRVVLLTPGCVDSGDKDRLKDYNDTLSRYADGIMELAKAEQLPVFNIHKMMLLVQDSAKEADPAFTMIPDGVHPSPPGQAIMAFGLLTALGCDGSASGLDINAANATAATDRCKVSNLKVTEDSITFRRTDDALPIYFDPEAASVLPYAPFLKTMNQYQFAVTGLKDGNWKLTVQGTDVGNFTATELAASVDLSDKPGPWEQLGKEVNISCKGQENAYFVRWRQVQLNKFPPDAKREVDALIRKLDKIATDRENARSAKVADRTWNWSLAFVK